MLAVETCCDREPVEYGQNRGSVLPALVSAVALLAGRVVILSARTNLPDNGEKSPAEERQICPFEHSRLQMSVRKTV